MLVKDLFRVGEVHEEIDHVGELVEVDHARVRVGDFPNQSLFCAENGHLNLRVVVALSDPNELRQRDGVVRRQVRRTVEQVLEGEHIAEVQLLQASLS